MRPLLAPLAVVLLSTGAFACGGTNKNTGSTPSTTAPNGVSPVRNLEDDNDGDNDNELVRSFAPEASAADTRTVTALVKRYYAAAYADDGATACSLLYTPLAKVIANEYGHSPDTQALHGKTCAAVLSKLFKQEHRRLAAEVAIMKVSTVRVSGNNGLVMLYFSGTRPERYFAVEREGGIWKMDTLLDNRLP
jgi:hypothetical protein